MSCIGRTGKKIMLKNCFQSTAPTCYHLRLKRLILSSILLCMTSLVFGCQKTLNTAPDEDKYVEAHENYIVAPMHSPQRKPQKIASLPFGAPLHVCIPNLPELLTVNPEETIKRYAHLLDGYDKPREIFMREATPLAETLTFDRWGDREVESPLVENSRALRVPFDIKNVNRFNAYEGRGLYVAESPISSLGYVLRHYEKHAEDKNWNLPMLVTVIVPKGTLSISYEKREFLLKHNLNPSYKSFIQEDYNTHQSYTPAPILIHYKSIGGRIPVTVDPYSTVPKENITTPIGIDWRVVKSAENIEVKEFDGQEASTKKLLEYDRVFRKAAFELKVPNAEKVYAYYKKRVTPILSKRIFNPGVREEIPLPLTALYPAKHWGQFDELKHCIGARIPHPQKDAIYYFWRFDGTCGGYADPEAKTLVIDPPIRRDNPDYRPLEDTDNHPCLAKFPVKPTWIRMEEGPRYQCFDAVQIHPAEILHAEKHDRSGYIVIGTHADVDDCGRIE